MSELCSQWYLPVVAAAGKRGSEKPEELEMFNMSEYELGSHLRREQLALSLALPARAGVWSFPWSSLRDAQR